MKKVTVQIDKPEKEDWMKIEGRTYIWNKYRIIDFLDVEGDLLIQFPMEPYRPYNKTLPEAQEACWQHYLKHHNMEKVDG